MVDPVRVALRCLIVDDSPLFLESATSLLQREGMEVVGVASNRTEALRLATELSPDVTLVDVDLGDEDGFELAQALDGRSKVIMISTHSETDLAQLIQASPALGFVSKHRLSASAISDLLERAEGS